MSNRDEPSDAERDYAEAYASHYGKGDLLTALRSYEDVISRYPNSPEAEYSRSQVRNIASLVVPQEALLTAWIDLAVRHLKPELADPAPAGTA